MNLPSTVKIHQPKALNIIDEFVHVLQKTADLETVSLLNWNAFTDARDRGMTHTADFFRPELFAEVKQALESLDAKMSHLQMLSEQAGPAECCINRAFLAYPDGSVFVSEKCQER